jgi:exodeoxyribonuclease VIII
MNLNAYHGAPGISSSNLRLLAESPVHLDNKHLFKLDSPALVFGNVVHKMILEPEDFENVYITAPIVDLRTNKGKDELTVFKAENADKIIVSADDIAKAERMAANVKAIAGNLLTRGKAEQSFLVDDDGLTYKCRPDYLREDLGLAIDIKTTSDASDYGMKKSVANYQYHWTAYWYLKVLNLAGLNITRYLFCFVESSPPYMVRLRELSQQSLNSAEQEIETLLAHYRHYKLTGKASIFKTLTGFGE